MISIQFERETFTASQTAAITGVSGMQQRNLRRLSHDAKSAAGWERRDVYGLARLLTMKTLSDFGVPPSASGDIADSASAIISAWAASCPGAVHDPENLSKGEPPVHMPERLPSWLTWSQQDQSFAFDVALTFSDYLTAPPAIVVLNLRRLASTLIERANRPLWRVVEIED